MTTTIHSPPRCHCESREVCEQFPSNRFPRPRRRCCCLRWVHHSPPFRSKSMWCDRQSREEPPHAHDCSFFLPRFVRVCFSPLSLSLSWLFFDYCQKRKISLSLSVWFSCPPRSTVFLFVYVCVCLLQQLLYVCTKASLCFSFSLSLSLLPLLPTFGAQCGRKRVSQRKVTDNSVC